MKAKKSKLYVSIKTKTYNKLKKHSDKNGVPMSTMTDMILDEYFTILKSSGYYNVDNRVITH